ncbi:MAG: hypothetical protein AB198_00900 [Parcubacteria bacterium C7867-003]|nr:MAG: hypothetical protein AB198_00900 [Parcubacteria bacterium C7867-003]
MNPEQNQSNNSPEGNVHNDPVMDFTKGNNNNLVMGVLSYLGPLVLIPYLTNKNNEFVKFHTKQGLVLFGIEVLIMFLGSMMSLMLVQKLLNLGALILTIIGIVNVVQESKKELPLVGNWANSLNI